MDIDISLAMENAEQQSQERRNSRNVGLRRQTIVNLTQGLLPYLDINTTNSFDDQFSNNHLLCSSDAILIDDAPYDVDFGPAETSSDETDNDEIIENQSNDQLISINDVFLSRNEQTSLTLHSYTNISQDEFSTKLLHLFRQANICKVYATKILKLINLVLPQPNNSPTSLKALLEYMQGNLLFFFAFFTKHP